MADLQIQLIPVLSDNYSYLVHEPESGVTAVVDPPVTEPFQKALVEKGWKLDWILATHHHPDHVAGIPELKAATGCKVAGPEGLADVDVVLRGGDTFDLGSETARVIATPGHTLDHLALWFEGSNALFSADALFALGCGRVFEGTMEQMWESLSRLAELPDETTVYCGHEYTESNAKFAVTVDPDNQALAARASEIAQLRAAGKPTVPSSLGVEKATNPFLRAADPAIRAHLGMENASDAEVFAEIRTRKDNA